MGSPLSSRSPSFDPFSESHKDEPTDGTWLDELKRADPKEVKSAILEYFSSKSETTDMDVVESEAEADENPKPVENLEIEIQQEPKNVIITNGENFDPLILFDFVKKFRNYGDWKQIVEKLSISNRNAQLGCRVLKIEGVGKIVEKALLISLNRGYSSEAFKKSCWNNQHTIKNFLKPFVNVSKAKQPRQRPSQGSRDDRRPSRSRDARRRPYNRSGRPSSRRRPDVGYMRSAPRRPSTSSRSDRRGSYQSRGDIV